MRPLGTQDGVVIIVLEQLLHVLSCYDFLLSLDPFVLLVLTLSLAVFAWLESALRLRLHHHLAEVLAEPSLVGLLLLLNDGEETLHMHLASGFTLECKIQVLPDKVPLVRADVREARHSTLAAIDFDLVIVFRGELAR